MSTKLPFKEQLRHDIMDQRYARCNPMLKACHSASPEVIHFEITHLHTVSVTIAAQFTATKGADIVRLKENATRHILSYVYGDILDDLYELYSKVYSFGDPEVERLVDSMIRKVHP